MEQFPETRFLRPRTSRRLETFRKKETRGLPRPLGVFKTQVLRSQTKVVREGLEHTAKSPKEKADSQTGGAEFGALGSESVELPSELQEVVDAWETLSVATKVGILAMVRTADHLAD